MSAKLTTVWHNDEKKFSLNLFQTGMAMAKLMDDRTARLHTISSEVDAKDLQQLRHQEQLGMQKVRPSEPPDWIRPSLSEPNLNEVTTKWFQLHSHKKRVGTPLLMSIPERDLSTIASRFAKIRPSAKVRTGKEEESRKDPRSKDKVSGKKWATKSPEKPKRTGPPSEDEVEIIFDSADQSRSNRGSPEPPSPPPPAGQERFRLPEATGIRRVRRESPLRQLIQQQKTTKTTSARANRPTPVSPVSFQWPTDRRQKKFSGDAAAVDQFLERHERHHRRSPYSPGGFQTDPSGRVPSGHDGQIDFETDFTLTTTI